MSHSTALAEVISYASGRMEGMLVPFEQDCVLHVLSLHSIHSTLVAGNRSRDLRSNHSTNNHSPATSRSASFVDSVDHD